jgi:hypothetical protein
MKWTHALYSRLNVVVLFALCFFVPAGDAASANSNRSRFLQWYRRLAAHIAACRSSRPRFGMCFDGDDLAGVVGVFLPAATDSVPALPLCGRTFGSRSRCLDGALGWLSERCESPRLRCFDEVQLGTYKNWTRGMGLD